MCYALGMKLTIRKYKFPSLSAYFEHQRKTYVGTGASRYTATEEHLDTHARLAERMGVSVSTIARVSAGLYDPSFELALRISKEVSCPPDGMGKSGVAK